MEWSWHDPEEHDVYDEIFMIDSNDQIYIGHKETGFLKKFDTQGKDITPSWNDPNWLLEREVVADGAIDPQGNVYLIADRSVVKFDANGQWLQTFASQTKNPSQGFFWPVGTAMSSDGSLYIRDENYSVFIFDLKGNPTARWTLPQDLLPYPLGESAMTINQEGHVFMAQDNLLVELSAQGEVLSSLRIPEMEWISALKIDPQGFLWINSSLGKIIQWDPQEKRILKELDLAELVRIAKGYEVHFEGFSLDINGNILMVDREKGAFIFDADGNLLSNFLFAPHRVPPYGLNYSARITLTTTDQDGNVYVVFEEYGEIHKYDSHGNFLGSWGQVGTLPGQMLRPEFIGINPDGNIVIVEHGNNRIQIFSPV